MSHWAIFFNKRQADWCFFLVFHDIYVKANKCLLMYSNIFHSVVIIIVRHSMNYYNQGIFFRIWSKWIFYHIFASNGVSINMQRSGISRYLLQNTSVFYLHNIFSCLWVRPDDRKNNRKVWITVIFLLDEYQFFQEHIITNK